MPVCQVLQTGAVTRFTLTEPWLSEGVLRGDCHHKYPLRLLHSFNSTTCAGNVARVGLEHLLRNGGGS